MSKIIVNAAAADEQEEMNVFDGVEVVMREAGEEFVDCN